MAIFETENQTAKLIPHLYSIFMVCAIGLSPPLVVFGKDLRPLRESLYIPLYEGTKVKV